MVASAKRFVNSERSTLLTSPLSMADFFLRLCFFSIAPIAIVFAAALFPVRGALIELGLALCVFAAGEFVQRWALRVKLLRALLRQALAYESYYRSRSPRPFVYYLAYPLLFPYWLINRDARREFLVFRGYTLGGLLVLIMALMAQYLVYWAPELTLKQYLPYVLLSLGVETLLALALLMPIATTVVWYHSSFRRRRLVVVLLAGLLSTSLAFYRISRRRAPLVSYATRERVALRTLASRPKAHRALLNAAHAAYQRALSSTNVEGDGNVTGEPLEQAHAALETYFKYDEASAFNVWASPRKRPKVVVVYFEARRHRRPIWVAIDQDGSEIRSPSQLPRGAFKAMRAFTQADEDWLTMWPDMLDYSEPKTASGHKRHGSAHRTTVAPPYVTRSNQTQKPAASGRAARLGNAQQ